MVRFSKIRSIREVLETSEDITVILDNKGSKEYTWVEKVVQNVEQNTNASIVDKAIACTYRLQKRGRIDEALRKWHDIADYAEGDNNNLAARAWFSIGYLHNRKGQGEKALSAYSIAIHLDRNYIVAYYNRGKTQRVLAKGEFAQGNAKSSLKRYESALVDYNEAIRRIPNYVCSYTNRGNGEAILDQFKATVVDY